MEELEYYTIEWYLDTRREKKNGLYPLKLRVYCSSDKKQKLYPIKGMDLSPEEYKEILATDKPKKNYRDKRATLDAVKTRANTAAKNIGEFHFEAFERLFLNSRRSVKRDVVSYYQERIEEYDKNNQIGTASNYDLSLKSLLKYHNNDELPFNVITPSWLKGYERWMTESLGRSLTTVGIYLRPLRAILNRALDNHEISAGMYPFGKKKYQIPAPRSTKKALTKKELQVLFEGMPLTEEQEKAKSFWFFSYCCNGMNMKDIANLQYKDFKNPSQFEFHRAKTAKTVKAPKPVSVFLTEYPKAIIKKYGNKKTSNETYVFNIVNHKDSAKDQHTQLQNFIRLVNQHFMNYAKSLGFTESISTYWARHSFATVAINSGASMEQAGEALGHSSMLTTQSYFKGFDTEKKKEIAKAIITFD